MMLFGLRKHFFTSVATTNAIKLSSPQHAINAATISAKPTKKIAYFVERTELGKNLPVYTDVRRNGQRIFTIIRRIYGNIQLLKGDLESVLPKKAAIEVRPDLMQIRIKGSHHFRIREFLTKKGF